MRGWGDVEVEETMVVVVSATAVVAAPDGPREEKPRGSRISFDYIRDKTAAAVNCI